MNAANKKMKRPFSISLIATLLVTFGIYILIHSTLLYGSMLMSPFFWQNYLTQPYFIIDVLLAPIIYIITGIGIHNGNPASRIILLISLIAFNAALLYRAWSYLDLLSLYFFIPLAIKVVVLWQLFVAPASQYFSTTNKAH